MPPSTPHLLENNNSPSEPSQLLVDAGQAGTGSTQPVANILVFGETGVGKSSVINMLAGPPYDAAKVSGDALGYTFGNISHTITIDGTRIVAWDTAGLNEGDHGTVSPEKALDNLQSLLANLGDGLSLLVYCVRGTRLSSVMKTNYDIFVKDICQGKVPVVLVVTGCENETPMDSWWEANEKELISCGVNFYDHACITSTLGKKLKTGEHMFEEEYKESEMVVRQLIVKNLLASPWVEDKTTWTRTIKSALFSKLGHKEPQARRREESGLTEQVAASRTTGRSKHSIKFNLGFLGEVKWSPPGRPSGNENRGSGAIHDEE
ncbi:hypothetical protein DXG01_005216 [Tephrocybe rancida]|nr:hypothetical protein DXG01_005216 [Tephrocybe rancida]